MLVKNKMMPVLKYISFIYHITILIIIYMIFIPYDSSHFYKNPSAFLSALLHYTLLKFTIFLWYLEVKI